MHPPVRRTKPPIVPLSDHLYSYGVDKLRRETTINSIPAVQWLCWEHIKGVPCDCDGKRAHLFAGYCGKSLSAELGAAAGCSKPGCTSPHPEGDVLASLAAWHSDVFGTPPITGTVSLVAPQSSASDAWSRSSATAAGLAAEHGIIPSVCTATPAMVASRLKRHAETSVHMRRLLEVDFLPAMLSQDSERRLLAQRGATKEVSEAFAMYDEIVRLARVLGASGSMDGCGDEGDASAASAEGARPWNGEGLTILDVCSGKGVAAALLSRLLPASQVVMLDSNDDMDLTHVAARANLRFVELDLFSPEAAALLHELADGDADGGSSPSALASAPALADASAPASASAFRATIAMGMHLCGALSPRLLALAAHLDAIDAVAICPCCLKGSLGDYVKKQSRAAKRDNYDVLLDTLQSLLERDLGPRGRALDVRRDSSLLSPRNGFISAVKARPRVAPRVEEEQTTTTTTTQEAQTQVQQTSTPPQGLGAAEGAANPVAQGSDGDGSDDDGSAAGSCRYRARVLYDGREFDGMQQQPTGKSVSDAVERALAKRFGSAVRVASAGRTDTGVHARGQALHFDLPGPADADLEGRAKPPPPADVLQRSLNAMLPDALRLSEMELASETDASGRRWHARLWATGKLYSYRVHWGDVLDPLDRLQRFHTGPRPLVLGPMRDAAGLLHGGPLDCAAFANRRAGEPLPISWAAAATTRVIRRIEVVDEGGGKVRLDFHVQSALYKMVRNMVGLLLAVGDGKVAPDDVPGLVASRDRSRLPRPAPAHGLTLEAVYYQEGWGGRYDHPLHPPKEEASS
jgi:tRNA pseudouridine(38-40) synthase